MDEFAHGGISRAETIGSASTRPSARVTSTVSVSSTGVRARICSSASSTVSMTSVYLNRGRSRLRRGGPSHQGLDGQAVAGEEPAPAQHEEREEAGGDEHLA